MSDSKKYKYDKSEFTTVPSKSARRGLAPKLQVIYLWLCDHSDKDHISFPSRETLADECGISTRSLDRGLQELEELGFIEKDFQYVDGRQTTNKYKVFILARGDDKKDTGGATEKTLGGATETAHRTQPISNSTHITQVISKDITAEPEFGNTEVNEIMSYWQEICGYPIAGKKNRYAAKNILAKHGRDNAYKLIRMVADAQTDKYAPTIGDLADLQQKLPQLAAYMKKRISGNERIVKL